MKYSVIVPAYNAADTISTLLESLAAQSFKDFEVILVDDASRDRTPQVIESFPYRLIRMAQNRGPAHCRNVGARNASGRILVFIDSDCRASKDWLETIDRNFSKNDAEALMGKLVLMPSTYLGDSISALGFPAGGAIGFEKIWKVDSKGYTHSLSTCNCAVKRDVFDRVGGFDASFPYAGGEDSLLAYCLKKNEFRIKYCPDVVVFHKARDSFSGFLRWQFRRGISSFIFSTKVSDKKSYVGLRIWSTRNILRHYVNDRKFPLIVGLLGTGLLAQTVGFCYAKHKRMVP